MTVLGSSMTAGYYADGQRMWKNYAGTTTYFLNDGGTVPACEFDGTGAITAFNAVGANGVLSRSAKSGSSFTPTFYAFDFRGNTVNRVSSTGTVLSNATYKAYNGRAADYSDGSPYEGFGGQYGYFKDFDNIYLMGQRYYAADQGRWLSRDPIAPRGYPAGGVNVYSFAGNNPISYADPSGLSTDGILVGAGTALLVTGAVIVLAPTAVVWAPFAVGMLAGAAFGGAVGMDQHDSPDRALTDGEFGAFGG